MIILIFNKIYIFDRHIFLEKIEINVDIQNIFLNNYEHLRRGCSTFVFVLVQTKEMLITTGKSQNRARKIQCSIRRTELCAYISICVIHWKRCARCRYYLKCTILELYCICQFEFM